MRSIFPLNNILIIIVLLVGKVHGTGVCPPNEKIDESVTGARRCDRTFVPVMTRSHLSKYRDSTLGSIADICDIVTGKCLPCAPGWMGKDCKTACPKKKFGRNCEETCHCYTDFTCDPVTGSCGVHGCTLGWIGDQCNVEFHCQRGNYGKSCQACGHCKVKCSITNCQGVCDEKTGHCPLGCQAFFTGDRCDECIGRRYGYECDQQCGHCYNGYLCHMITGICGIHGCDPGYMGTRCDLECRPGRYGMSCAEICSSHCRFNEPCSISDGSCPSGCHKGWQLPKCDRPLECGNHSYGAQCDRPCHHCYNNSECSQSDGSCTDGCDPGFYGLKCDHECSDGWYGINCTKRCGQCLSDTVCDRVTGHCPNGCNGQFLSPICTGCRAGWFGNDCSENCGHCRGRISCDPQTGLCKNGCASGFTGHFCQTRKTK